MKQSGGHTVIVHLIPECCAANRQPDNRLHAVHTESVVVHIGRHSAPMSSPHPFRVPFICPLQVGVLTVKENCVTQLLYACPDLTQLGARQLCWRVLAAAGLQPIPKTDRKSCVLKLHAIFASSDFPKVSLLQPRASLVTASLTQNQHDPSIYDFGCQRQYVIEALQSVSLRTHFKLCESGPLAGKPFTRSPAWCLLRNILALQNGTGVHQHRPVLLGEWAHAALTSPTTFTLWSMLLGAVDGLLLMKMHHLLAMTLDQKIAFWSYFATLPNGHVPWELWHPEPVFQPEAEHARTYRCFSASRVDRRIGLLAVAPFLNESKPLFYANIMTRLPVASLVTLFRNTNTNPTKNSTQLAGALRKETILLLARWSSAMTPLYALAVFTLQKYIESKLGQTATPVLWAKNQPEDQARRLHLQWEGHREFGPIVQNIGQILRQVAHLTNQRYDDQWFVGASLTEITSELVMTNLWTHLPSGAGRTCIATTRRVHKLANARKVLADLVASYDPLREAQTTKADTHRITPGAIFERAQKCTEERYGSFAPPTKKQPEPTPLVQHIVDRVATRTAGFVHAATVLNQEQQVAFHAIHTCPLVAIHGPPGTGKTTLLRNLQSAESLPGAWITESEDNSLRDSYRAPQLLQTNATHPPRERKPSRPIIPLPATRQQPGPSLLYLSPTNMTAASVFQNTGFMSRTLAMCYKYVRHRIDRELRIMHAVRLLVMDEASMLSDKTFVHLSRIVSYLHLHGSLKRVVLIGDVLQLPAISAGQPFLDLLTDGHFIRVVQLSRDMRTVPTTPRDPIPQGANQTTDQGVTLSDFKQLARKVSVLLKYTDDKVYHDQCATTSLVDTTTQRLQFLDQASMPPAQHHDETTCTAWPFHADLPADIQIEIRPEEKAGPMHTNRRATAALREFQLALFPCTAPSTFDRNNPWFHRPVVGAALESIDEVVALIRMRTAQVRGGGVVITFRNNTCAHINRLLCRAYKMDVFLSTDSTILTRLVPGLKIKVLNPCGSLCKNEVVALVGVQAILRLRGKGKDTVPDLTFPLPATDTTIKTIPGTVLINNPTLPSTLANYSVAVGIRYRSQKAGEQELDTLELPTDLNIAHTFGPGFCVTVDSMQGGEVDNVVYAMDRVPWENLYTACTRGKKSVTFVHNDLFTQRKTYNITVPASNLLYQCATFHLKYPRLPARLFSLLLQVLTPPKRNSNDTLHERQPQKRRKVESV